MIEGPLDNYLDDKMSAEERAYFNGRGSETSEEKVTEALADEQIGEPDSGDVSQESEHEDRATDEPVSDAERGDENDDASYDADDESDAEEEPKLKADRDYEKAFKTERHKRKELREALELQAKKSADMEAALNQLRQNMLNQQQQQQVRQEAPAKQEPTPDPEEDPLGYMQHQMKLQERAIIEQNKYLTQRHEHEQRQAQENAFKQVYVKSAQEFSKKQSDFKDAYNYLAESKIAEYVAAGFDENQANALLMEDEMAIVTKAYTDKVNPAERLYKLAKTRGYAAGSGEKKAPAAKNLADIKKGMANSKSLKSGGGQPTDREAGMDDIDRMNFDEFDTYWAKLKASSKGMG